MRPKHPRLAGISDRERSVLAPTLLLWHHLKNESSDAGDSLKKRRWRLKRSYHQNITGLPSRRIPYITSPFWRDLCISLALVLMTVATMWSEQAVELAESMQALYRGDYERAALLAEKYTKAHPKVAAAWVLLARVEMAQGKYLAAYHQLREALRLEPRNVDTLYYLGQLANTLSQLEFQKLYAMAPDSARVHQLQAELYRVQENTAKAEEEYLAALKANPRSVEVLVALGDLARAGSRFNEALTYYSRAHEVDPRNYDSTYGLAACYHFRQEPEKAIQFFRQATSIDPDSAAARLALGDALLRSGQASAAITELKAALTLEPKMRQAYTLLGRAQQRLGQSREAEESFKKAEELIQSEMKSRESLLSAGDLLSGPPARSQDK